MKKNDYYKKLKEDRESKAKQLPIPDQRFIRKKKSQMKQNDNETEDDGFGHKVKLLDIPGTVQVFYEERTSWFDVYQLTDKSIERFDQFFLGIFTSYKNWTFVK